MFMTRKADAGVCDPLAETRSHLHHPAPGPDSAPVLTPHTVTEEEEVHELRHGRPQEPFRLSRRMPPDVPRAQQTQRGRGGRSSRARQALGRPAHHARGSFEWCIKSAVPSTACHARRTTQRRQRAGRRADALASVHVVVLATSCRSLQQSAHLHRERLRSSPRHSRATPRQQQFCCWCWPPQLRKIDRRSFLFCCCCCRRHHQLIFFAA